jgi:hypothetical protein
MNMQASAMSAHAVGFSADGERAEKDKGPQMRNRLYRS